MKTIFFVLLLLMSGCTTVDNVVTTEISFNKSDGTLHIASPKDISITGLSYERTEQGVKVSIEDYTAKGNTDAIKAVESQNNAISSTAKALSDLVNAAR